MLQKTTLYGALVALGTGSYALAAPQYQFTDSEETRPFIQNPYYWGSADYFGQADGAIDVSETSGVIFSATNDTSSLTNLRIGTFNTGQTATFSLYEWGDNGERTLLTTFDFQSNQTGYQDFELDSPVLLDPNKQYAALVSRTAADSAPAFNYSVDFIQDYADFFESGSIQYESSYYYTDEAYFAGQEFLFDSAYVGVIDLGITDLSGFPNNVAVPSPAALPIGLSALGIMLMRRKRESVA